MCGIVMYHLFYRFGSLWKYVVFYYGISNKVKYLKSYLIAHSLVGDGRDVDHAARFNWSLPVFHFSPLLFNIFINAIVKN